MLSRVILAVCPFVVLIRRSGRFFVSVRRGSIFFLSLA